MAVVVGDVVRITARMLLDGSNDIVNVYHFVVDANITADDTAFMVDVAQELDDLYILINDRVSDRVSYSSVQGFNVTQNVLLPDTEWDTLVAGSDATEMMPEMVTGCVFHRTVAPRVRATKFLPPVGEQSNDGGALQALYKTLVESFGAALITGLITGNIDLQYIAFNTVASTFNRVVSSQVPARFRTQRRRRLGVGS